MMNSKFIPDEHCVQKKNYNLLSSKFILELNNKKNIYFLNVKSWQK